MLLKDLPKINTYIKKSLKFDQYLLKVPVKENGEKFVSLKEYIKKSKVKIILNPKPIILKADKKIFYLRKSVCLSLIKAAEDLNNKGYVLQVQDAYRSLLNQKQKFFVRVKEIKNESPQLNQNDLYNVANMYTAGIPLLAAHIAGAAVDVILLDSKLNKIDMGSEYPLAASESMTDFKKLPKKIKDLRKILSKIMLSNGLINYPFEWWHYSKGDVCATYLIKKKYAIYGPVEFNPFKKSIKYFPIGKSYSFFS